MNDDKSPPAATLSAEDVVRRIAAECAFVDAHGGVGIRLQPAAALVRQYGEQFARTATTRSRPRRLSARDPNRQPALLLPVTGARRPAPKPGAAGE